MFPEMSGASKEKKYLVQVIFRLTPEEKESLFKSAKRRGVHSSKLLRQLIQDLDSETEIAAG